MSASGMSSAKTEIAQDTFSSAEPPVLKAPAPSQAQDQRQTQPEKPETSAPEAKERNSIRDGSLSITATPKTNPETVKEDKPPAIEVDSTNIRSVPKSSVQPISESKRLIPLTSKLPDDSLAELKTAMETFTLCVRIASAKKLLAGMAG